MGKLKKNIFIIYETLPMATFTLNIFFFFFSIRIYPHDQNTGGFFIAVLEKSKLLPKEKVLIAKDGVPFQPPPDKKRKLGFKEDPFVFFKEGEEIWKSIK